ncbi:hypothetical protein GN244_ATG12004 [Phytophthora infestans]|uniref:Uncharacterized protein n=1 Tax=Phytophthora infestans TaxID=4787 RepID=A0A833WI60_PHYIN|nr:hypothetical protein GN244_ATG12004 [Phytophthora infestans]KAF4138076.1 hypothetical protein GN958_ATG12685 [Phytophthora infestans]
MDGLFTVYDRANERVCLAIADNCPNDVTSSQNITIETMTAEDSFCDCVGSADRKSSLGLLAHGYFWWKRRKLTRHLEALQS